MLYVTIESASCVGCGSCEAICPDIFSINNHGIAHAISETTEQYRAAIKDAIKMCPTKCIFLDED